MVACHLATGMELVSADMEQKTNASRGIGSEASLPPQSLPHTYFRVRRLHDARQAGKDKHACHRLVVLQLFTDRASHVVACHLQVVRC